MLSPTSFNPAPLPFLFVAEYDDGQTYYQTPHDTSIQSPLRSAFYDIRTHPLIHPESRLAKFGLIRTSTPIFVASIDLRTGTFYIGQTPIPTFTNLVLPQPNNRPLTLIYEKRNELNLTLHTHKITYRIGWSCESDWLAIDLDTHPNKITLRGSHERTARPELAAALVG